MKSSRRNDTENPRRDSRDRDSPHTSNSRFGRKRPSMLSEFHGSKHYNHISREGDRDSDLLHYRPHNRYSHDASASAVSSSNHAHSFPSSGFHSKSKTDSRSRYSHQHRTHTHHHSNSHHHTNLSDSTPEDEIVPVKRPRLMVDVTQKGYFDAPSSNDSVGSFVFPNSSQAGESLPVTPPHHISGGLSAYHLEDIDSDDDSLLRDEEDKQTSKSPTPVPSNSPVKNPESQKQQREKTLKAERKGSPWSSPMPSKEELLTMMEKVDRDIAAVETQISALQKKQAELEDTARTGSGTPHSSTFSSLPSPITPSSDQASALMSMEGEDTAISSPSPSNRTSPKKTQMDIIYSDNRGKSRSAQSVLSSLNFPPLPGLTALYHQPSEAPPYCHNILSHKSFRPKLIQYVRERKLEKHKKELLLCEKYDSQMARWEKSVHSIETSLKKKQRDLKNRELFERCFPELKAKREHQERLTRVDQRGYGTVRSDAELKEIMYEICEQEEAPVRYRRTHAAIPPMLTEERDQRVRFYNTNGLIDDPMAFHRDSRFVSVWSEEEKATLRDKYMFHPKNFEVIASFLPNKSPADCVLYYYLSKKREKFKHLIRRANLKRKKPFVKPSDFSNSPLIQLSVRRPSITLFPSSVSKLKTEEIPSQEEEEESENSKSECYDWSLEEISNLKEGLRKYGRAWGKIYREVGGQKTATQCKQFYDKHCTNKELELSAALAEHSSMKNAEKLRRKAERRTTVVTEMKRKVQRNLNRVSSVRGSEEIDSENTASAYETESNSDESSSESTITDSSHEDTSSSSAFVSLASQPKNSRGMKTKLDSNFRRTSEEALDLFISAAEALNNIIPPEVALHDHNYALPPCSLVNMDLGTSGLSLIAAAAAVVSPTLSRSAGGGSSKIPSLSPVRAPRGRPPNSQRKGTNSTTSKLSPTLLSPAGTSPSVLLAEMKAAPLRGRARSTTSDRPKMSTLHIPRAGSTLARMSINSSSRSMSRATALGGPPSSYSRHKNTLGSSNNSPSLKSMIALHPTTSNSPTTTTTATNSTSAFALHPTTSNSPTTTTTATNSTSAFEALVNVAVAAPPAELPQSSVSSSSPSSSHILSLHSSTSSCSNSKSSSPVTTLPFTATPLSRSKDTVTIGVTGSNSNTSNSGGGTTTAYIDVNQAINILASLAQQQVSSSVSNGGSQPISVLPNQRIFAQTPANLIGSIMAQGSKSNISGGLMSSNLTTSKTMETLSMDTLLGHLTSGIGSQAAAASRNAVGGKGGSAMLNRTLTSKPEGSANKSNLSSMSSTTAGKGFGGGTSSSVTGIPQSIQVAAGTMDDLSNLNLLSTLVAAVAASQSTATPTPSQPSTTSGNMSASSSVGQPSNIYSSKTDLRRLPPESAVTSTTTTTTTTTNRNVYRTTSSSLVENSNSSTAVISQAYTPNTTLEDPPSIASYFANEKQREHDREVDKLIAASSSIKKNASSVTNMHGYPSGMLLSSNTTDDLPRSVVRTGLGSLASDLSKQNTTINVSSTESDMTASLASIIPSYNSSIGSQSSLLLYTRSLSFPLSVTSEPMVEEEDHLESATRGISELSKLLGTDSTSDPATNTRHKSPTYKDLSPWNPSDLLTNSNLSDKNVSKDFVTSVSENSYLSGFLESQIHGTVHHTSLTAPPKLTNSASNSTRESTLDIDHSR